MTNSCLCANIFGMQYLKRILTIAYIFIPLSLVAMVFPNKTFAQQDCSVTSDDITQLNAIQNDPTLSYSDELIKELALRKSLLSKTITCAQNEAKTLKTEIDNAPVGSSDKNIQMNFSGEVNDAINYYNLELQKVNNAGIMGTKQIASEVFTWRNTTYVSLLKKIDNFILWSQNQPLFSVASDRMSQITPMISLLSQVNNNDLNAAFSDAQSSFNTAKQQNTYARNAIAESLSSSQALGFIQQSLQSLSQTYQDISNISQIIQGLFTTPYSTSS
jgi:hypothetical protein